MVDDADVHVGYGDDADEDNDAEAIGTTLILPLLPLLLLHGGDNAAVDGDDNDDQDENNLLLLWMMVDDTREGCDV